MCGLAGILAPRSSEIPVRVQRMVRGLVHRGPDGEGACQFDIRQHLLAFGHTRLAIIDRSAAGNQPMIDPETGNAIIYNGEIYNFAVLRTELMRDGVHFTSRCDTEVLLKGLIRWGMACFPKLRGMYAFAYFDKTRNSVLLARDPMGIKPLFFARDSRSVVFASEVRAILASGLVDSTIDRAAIGGLLAYGAVQQPLTMYQAIRAVPPGAWIEVSVGADGELHDQVHRYWHLPLPDATRSESSALRDTKEFVGQAVTSHLVSDVPVAVFLSSGLDSTIVSTLAAKASPTIQTFTVGLGDHVEHDESLVAAHTAQLLDVHHTTIQLPMSEARENVLGWLAEADQPCMDGLNTYIISRAVKGAGITVALSGQGGDELFGGYPSFGDVPRLARWVRGLRRLPTGARRAAVGIASIGRSRAFAEKLFDAMETDGSLLPIYLQRRRALSDSQMNGLGFASDGSRAPFMPSEALEQLRLEPGDDLYNISAMELQFYLGNTLLPVGDVSSMASSLELRVPFLDATLLEAIAAVPGPVRLPDGRPDKHLLRSTFGRYLRPEIQALKKRGFSLPLGSWMAGGLRPQCEDFLSSLRGSGLVDPGGVDAVWNAFLAEPLSPMWSRAWVLCALGSHVHYSKRVAQ